MESKNVQISIEHLSKSFGEETVLNDLSLTLSSGCAYGLMAPSGAGKTTFFRILMGLETPDSGAIRGLAGLRISAVFQEDRLLEQETALQNLRFVTGRSYSVQELYGLLLRLLPADSLDKPVREFSGGMKRRTSILRALLAPSDLILMDEPFTGLDRVTRETAIALIKEYTKKKIFLFSTHSEEEIRLFHGELLSFPALR